MRLESQIITSHRWLSIVNDKKITVVNILKGSFIISSIAAIGEYVDNTEAMMGLLYPYKDD